MASRPPPPEVREYRLDLRIEHPHLKWTGVVELDLIGASPRLWLDSGRLEIDRAQFEGHELHATVHPTEETVELSELPASDGTLRLSFRGDITNPELIGFYQTRHGDTVLLTTQCAPVGAHRIFPCVDRPDRRSVYRVRVMAPTECDVVFNTEPATVRTYDGVRAWEFVPTPPMVSYLFYLGVGAFGRAHRPGERPITVYAARGREGAGAFALDPAARMLAVFENYYRVPYPLAKLDLIAVPEHPYGAMENWGAISFREQRLLVDGSAGALDRQAVLDTLAHEIAHQWFGNLVTMRWWTDIWLNESFATLLEAKVLDELYPELGAEDHFQIQWRAAALGADSLAATHPVSVPVDGPEEISQVFDLISYGKGASILRMIESFLGPERFRRGVTDYLRTFRLGNASTQDLWSSLERATGQRVAAILDPWVERSGFPLVEASVAEGGLRLRQRTFRLDGRHEDGTWPIPIVGQRNGESFRLLFDAETRHLSGPPLRSVHLNSAGTGFYRVLYDPELRALCYDALASYSATDRWVLLNDATAFLVSGDLAWPEFAGLLTRGARAGDLLAVHATTRALWQLGHWLRPVGAFRSFATSLIRTQSERLGEEGRAAEPAGVEAAREWAAHARVHFDREFALRLAGRLREWDHVPPDLRLAVAQAAALTGGRGEFERLRSLARDATTENDQSRVEIALSWFADPSLVEETLGLALSGSINRGHVPAVLQAAAQNPHGRRVMFDWLPKALPELERQFRGVGFLSQIAEEALPYLGLGRAEELRASFPSRSYPEASRGVARGFELLRVGERLLGRLRALA